MLAAMTGTKQRGHTTYGESAESVNRVRGGLAFKAHRLVYHSTLGLRVIRKKEEDLPQNEERRH